ncbi:MAG: guanylate kinase [Holosporales bacterium]|jgi:guanylate kinase|nr:guanylate kinase [Holosporales bacterium]
MTKKMIFVFSGPSGAGKTTLIRHILQTFSDEIGESISCTTRQPRGGELDGISYHFISPERFNTFVENGEFLEYTECYGNRYGTLKSSIDDLLKHKMACIMDVEYIGAHSILSGPFPPNTSRIGILVLPPSIAALKNRLLNRKSETEESLNRRIQGSFDPEIVADYHHILINEEIKRSKESIIRLIENSLINTNNGLG